MCLGPCVRVQVQDNATLSCFQAVIIGSINSHCLPEESLRYGSLHTPHLNMDMLTRRLVQRSVRRSSDHEPRKVGLNDH